MNKITSLDDLIKRIDETKNIAWFGPRVTDIYGVDNIFNIRGAINCYSENAQTDKYPILSLDSDGKRIKSSGDDLAKLLDDIKYLEFIKKNNIDAIFPYDNPVELEEFCKINKLDCYSSSSENKDILRDKTIIEKISSDLKIPVIKGVTGYLKDFVFEKLKNELGLPLFLQFDGSAGSGNYIVNNETEYEEIKLQRLNQKLNIKKYIKARSCSIDICVTKKSVLCGTLEDMLIGAPPLNSNPTEYVGGSWLNDGYSDSLRIKIRNIAISLGKYVRERGFLGYFHPDFLVEGDNVYLTELNMRFGGSCGIYVKAELSNNRIPLMGIHLMSFIDPQIEFAEDEINKINLSPLNYSFAVIKNNFKKDIYIPGNIKNGLYINDGKSLKFVKKTVDFKDLTDLDHILIIGLPEYNDYILIKDGAFICQVVTRQSIINNESHLNDEGLNLANKVIQLFRDL